MDRTKYMRNCVLFLFFKYALNGNSQHFVDKTAHCVLLYFWRKYGLTVVKDSQSRFVFMDSQFKCPLYKILQHLGAQDEWFIMQTHEDFSPVSLHAHSSHLSYTYFLSFSCDVRVKSKIVSRSMFWAAVETWWRNMASYTIGSLCK